MPLQTLSALAVIILSRAVALVSRRSGFLGPETTKMHTWRKKNEVPDSMLPQHDDDTHDLAR